MKAAFKAYQFYYRFRSLPSEIANVLSHLPSTAIQYLHDKYVSLETTEQSAKSFAKFLPKPLIVLIHGTSGGPWQWIFANQCLISAGFESHCMSYASENRIAKSAALLFKDLCELAAGTQRPFVLIGHSQGGILARMLYEQCKEEENMLCTKVFILHAPQKGTKAARMWNGLLASVGLDSHVKDSMRDMEDGAEFVRFYEQCCVKPDDPNVFEAAGSKDYVQAKEALFSSLPANRYIGDYGHYSAMVDKKLWTKFIVPNLDSSDQRQTQTPRQVRTLVQHQMYVVDQ